MSINVSLLVLAPKESIDRGLGTTKERSTSKETTSGSEDMKGKGTLKASKALSLDNDNPEPLRNRHIN